MKGERKLRQDIQIHGIHICDKDYHGCDGVTRYSLEFWKKIKSMAGDIVRAEMTFNNDDWYRLFLTNENNTVFEFRGFSSGFGGEGPRGVVEVLKEAGFDPMVAEVTVFKKDNQSWVLFKYGSLVTR